jgi:hypothetical protein
MIATAATPVLIDRRPAGDNRSERSSIRIDIAESPSTSVAFEHNTRELHLPVSGSLAVKTQYMLVVSTHTVLINAFSSNP